MSMGDAAVAMGDAAVSMGNAAVSKGDATVSKGKASVGTLRRVKQNHKRRHLSKCTEVGNSSAKKIRISQSSIRTPNTSCSDTKLSWSEEETFSEPEESCQIPSTTKTRKRVNVIVDSSSDENGDTNDVVLLFDEDKKSETGESEQIFTCKYCKFSTSSAQNDELRDHLQSKHMHLLKLSKCGHCDDLYGNVDRLKKHTENSHPGKPEMKETPPLTSFYHVKEKENCSPKHRSVESDQTQPIKMVERRLDSAKSTAQRNDLPQQTAHSGKDTSKKTSLGSDESGPDKSPDEEMMPVMRSGNTAERRRNSGREDGGRTAAKQARLTMQVQLQQDGSDSCNSDEEYDPRADHQRPVRSKGKRFAFLDSEEFKKNKKHRPKPKSKLPASAAAPSTTPSASNQCVAGKQPAEAKPKSQKIPAGSTSSPGHSSQSTSDTGLVIDHSAVASAAAPSANNQCVARKRPAEADTVAVALGSPSPKSSTSPHQVKSNQPTSANGNQAAATRTYRYVAVLGPLIPRILF